MSDQLVAAGANIIDGTDPSVIRAQVGEHVLCQSGMFTDPESLATQLASRPLLEAHVRRRVRDIPNVSFLANHDVVQPILGQPDRVTAVRVVDRTAGTELLLEADLVVDATGRAARTPAFLAAHGYPAPPEQKYAVGLSYSSQFFQMPPGALAEKLILTAPTVERPTGLGLLAYEHGTVILTLIGIAGHQLPKTLPGMMALVGKLLPDTIIEALRAAEPLGDLTTQHYPASVWRRYDKLKRFPKGLISERIGHADVGFSSGPMRVSYETMTETPPSGRPHSSSESWDLADEGESYMLSMANVAKHVSVRHENGPQSLLREPFPLVAGTGFEPATSGL